MFKKNQLKTLISISNSYRFTKNFHIKNFI